MPPRMPTVRLAHTTHRITIPRPQLRPQKPTPKRTFTSTRPTFAREQNFYEILDLPTTATAAEIKKQFYALSMRHHPDRNRDDPSASQRFARISSAYNVLGNASKRDVYDRDNGFHRIHASATPGHTHAHPMGSHSSHGSYAGSRPASGLSKRRTPFHGPPPSFYQQGGYGATGRQSDGYAAGKSGSSATGSAGSGRSADPEHWEGFIHRNPLHHFNAHAHFRTQAAEDRRRMQRANAWKGIERDGAPDTPWPEPEIVTGFSFGRFFFSAGCLICAGFSALFWPAPPDKQAKR